MLFGATGDLALRMLFPSLYFLDASDLLPPGMRVVGAARSELAHEAFVQMVREAIEARADGGFSETAWARFAGRLAYVSFDAGQPESFQALAGALEGASRTIFYLSTSPGLFGPICTGLKAAGLAHAGSRMVVEKPIGRDLKSCQAINDVLADAFSEDRIFRVDHYLGKEGVQDLRAVRVASALCEPLWNKSAIDHV